MTKVSTTPLKIQEVDGTPSNIISTFKFPNNSLTDNGDGSYTVDFGLSGYVPYTGATSNVDLGAYNITTTGTGTFGSVVIPTLFSDTQDPTGFVTRVGATPSWDDGTYTFTLTGNHDIYINGIKTAKTTFSKQITDSTGIHWLYYDTDGVVQESLDSSPGFQYPLIASIYWNTTINKALVGDERHGIKMDFLTHGYLHNTVGTRYYSGLAGTFGNTTFTVTAGQIYDEDIANSIAEQNNCDVLYKNGSANYEWQENQTTYYYTSGGNLYYNNGNVLTAVDVNKYIAVWIFATNSITRPIISIIGQRQDTTLTNARNNNKYESLSLGTLPFAEMKLLYRVILRNDATPYEETQDLRSVSNLPSGTYVATAHNVLTGLNWDVAGHIINTDFVATTDNTYDNGSALFRWKDFYLGGTINNGTYTYTLPGHTGNILVDGADIDLRGYNIAATVGKFTQINDVYNVVSIDTVNRTLHTTTGGVSILDYSGNDLKIKYQSLPWVIFNAQSIASSDKTFTFPNDSGTFALSTSGTFYNIDSYINQAVLTTSDPTFNSVTLTTPLAFTSGGTGLSSATQYAIPYFNTTTSIGQIGIGTAGNVLAVNSNANGYEWVIIPVPTIAFTDLTDVPGSYSGQGGKYVKVNAGETGLEFAAGSGGVTDHNLLNNLNWASAGHTFDTNLSLGAYFQEFSEIATPATPAANAVRLYAKDNSGVSALYYVGDDGVEVGPLGAGGGAVSSVFGRTGAVVAVTNDYTWGQIDKTTSDIADITTKSHTSLSDIGTNTHAQIDSHIANTSNPHSTTAAQVSAVPLTGGANIAGLITFTDTLPQSSITPANDADLTTKTYVDSLVTSGTRFVGNVNAATTAALPACTYNNGVLGVGATLTANANGALPAQDGVTLTVGQYLLVKNQVAALQNGSYTVTQVGSGGSPWILTRATNYDQSAEVVTGTFFTILAGTTLANSQWAMTTNSVIVMGTTAIVFSQLSAPIIYTASNGITLASNNFKLGGTLVETTTIAQGNYDFVYNLSGTGDFNVQDNGTTRFQIDDGGLIGIGGTTLASAQAYIKPQGDAYKGLVIRQNSATQSANLLDVQNASGTSWVYIRPDGYTYHTITNDQTTYPTLTSNQTASTLQSNSTGTTDESLDNAYEAFQITSSGAHNVRAIAVDLKRTGTISNTTGYYTAYIYSDNAGVPGSVLATSTTRVYYGTLTTSYVTHNFGFSYTMASSTLYWIVLGRSATPTGGTIELRRGTSGTNTYAYATTPPAWTTESSKSPRYYIYGRTGYAFSATNVANYAGYFNSSTTYAIYALSDYGTAVYGVSNNGFGIYGSSAYSYGGYFTSTAGSAVYGNSTSGYGLYGTSTSGTAIYGISTSNYGIYGNTTSGTAIYGVSSTGTSLNCATTSGIGAIISANPATTNTEHELQRWTRNTSATAAAGIGLQNNFYIESAAGTSRNAGRMSVVLTDATNAAEDADLYVSLMTNGTLTEQFRVKDTGVGYLRGGIALKETGASPTYYTILQSGDLTGANSTYTFPTAYPAGNNYLLRSSTGGVMSWVDPATVGVTDHAALSNLNWAAAAHTFDIDLDIGVYKFQGTGIGLLETRAGTIATLYPSAGMGGNIDWYLPNADQAGFMKSDGAGNLSFDTNISASVDHGAVAGLGDDDHTQYVLLLGRAAGQTIIGGTGINDILKLQATSGAACAKFEVNISSFTPDNDAGADLGLPTTRFRHVFASGNLDDGTNSLTIANAKTAYDHSQDNTQAHSDYLLNSGDDGTSTTEPAYYFTISTTTNNATKSALKLRHYLSSGSIADGFGVSLDMHSGDGLSADILAATIKTVREGANDRYSLEIWNNNAGTQNQSAEVHYQGIWDFNDQSRARAYDSTGTTINNETKITLNTENYDSQGEFDSTTNYRFTATYAGYYQVNAVITIKNPVSGLQLCCRIKKNGTSYCEAIDYFEDLTGNAPEKWSVQVSDVIYLAATDYIELFGDDFGTSGGGINDAYGTTYVFMSVHKLS